MQLSDPLHKKEGFTNATYSWPAIKKLGSLGLHEGLISDHKSAESTIDQY